MARVITYDKLGSVELRLQKNVGTPAEITVTYSITSSTGPTLTDTIDLTLTGAQTTQLRDFMTNVVVPQINTKEGL